MTKAIEERTSALSASQYKDAPVVNQNSRVRRLTPTECARLQGFPDWWCSDLETINPSNNDLAFWRKVFEQSGHPKTDKQIIKWLKNPHTDAAEYRMWGNGVALPCVTFVLAGIEWAVRKEKIENGN